MSGAEGFTLITCSCNVMLVKYQDIYLYSEVLQINVLLGFAGDDACPDPGTVMCQARLPPSAAPAVPV